MDFNFNPEDEAFRMEFRAWLDANKQFAPHMGETTIGMAEGRGEFDQQKRWAKKMAEGRWLAPSSPAAGSQCTDRAALRVATTASKSARLTQTCPCSTSKP